MHKKRLLSIHKKAYVEARAIDFMGTGTKGDRCSGWFVLSI
ncbi:MAG: hypothetical protein P2A85_16645 [Microcoleus anatoxicus]